jgi:hypothetical protein
MAAAIHFDLDWEASGQDGFDFCAVLVKRRT